ncbi:MAG: sigma 54-interacting transcriptional regulator [candidate division KSB1 bacterium]|nr:sigma 54-interacting transcriptional regulator [candidate division KSB1 bacterium]MDZ7369433.1 sigma 54-interacting transcriptional regulator [candidate division KSB1 bacterium]MDZ7404956.1 sigma 54-interacting transcriptional regulator [candidate division KSB1 bacterium]
MDESIFITSLQPLIVTESPEAEVRLSKDDLRKLFALATKYRTLYDVGKLVASEMETDALLRLAMDKVIEVTRAQRGFIALVENKNKLDFKVARNIEKGDIDQPHFQVSRSVIEKVMANGETICLRDAMADATFGGAESVMRLQLLSVLCTPIKIEARVAGVIYVDNSNVKQLFDETVADLLTAFAEQIAIALKNAYVFSDLKKSHQQLANELRANYKFDNIIGSGPAMTKILQLVAQVADTDTTVLIQGENGTGKELIARALHYNSSRKDKPFVVVNCGAIPETLIESELFGHEKGAFTGAINRKQGKFELADGGTVFLDEIGEMSPAMQVKLLRVLQDGTFSPVGSAAETQCDVRVIAATNRELKKMLAEKTFREDLYYRLNVINLAVPPLRERREDLLLLVAHFLKKHGKANQSLRLSKAAEQTLLDYDYPGNVRQLENIIQRAVILCKGEMIEAHHLPEDLQAAGIYHEANPQAPATFQERKQRVIEKFERDELSRILTQTGGKVRESARIAGMDVKNFSEKLQRYGMKAEEYKR